MARWSILSQLFRQSAGYVLFLSSIVLIENLCRFLKRFKFGLDVKFFELLIEFLFCARYFKD